MRAAARVMAFQAFWGAWLAVNAYAVVHYASSERWIYAAFYAVYGAVAAYWIVRNVRRAS